ncbi:MAG TPA: PEGA domain-containing protein [Candidatus Saccharimonadales bacterium]|nr:PEGA domain-containing protein [Candidatus Saccharimonadales bacterium]
MDYLDPKKEARHRIMLFVGYVLIGIAIVIGTLILLYQAYGFGIGKNGTVIQNGLVFFSSQPNPANIYVDGKLNKSQTNTRLTMPAGIYHIQLARSGYRDWQRTIEVEGGDVQHFDYPFLIPTKLTTKKIADYTAAPALTTQSPDRRWLMVQTPGSMTAFQVYDLKNPTKAPLELHLPDGLLSKATSSENWQLEEWADDDKHVVLQHNYDGKSEYILIDRTDASQALNLNTTLSASPAKLTLLNKKYDQYYLLGADGTLQSATLSDHTPKTVLTNVLAYQSYASDTILYATSKNAPAGKVLIQLRSGGNTYPIRSFAAGSTYLLDLTKYDGTLYVTAGASGESKIYIYKDPIGQLNNLPHNAVYPIQVLHVDQPNYLSFSNNAQFVVAENGTQFGVYDIENTKGYNFTSQSPVDAPATHATWMDGDRLTYVSGGKLIIFDYDDTNQQTLVAASPSYLPAFAPDFKFVYTLAPSATAAGQENLDQTALLTPADQ